MNTIDTKEGKTRMRTFKVQSRVQGAADKEYKVIPDGDFMSVHRIRETSCREDKCPAR
jgi:hypothetical protein